MVQSVVAVAAVQLPQYSSVKPSLPRPGTDVGVLVCGSVWVRWVCLAAPSALGAGGRGLGWCRGAAVAAWLTSFRRALTHRLTLTLRPRKVCFLCRVRERVDWVGLTLG